MTGLDIATGTRLFYEVIPGTIPVGAPATIALVVSNQGLRPLDCDGIAFGPFDGLSGDVDARPAGGTVWEIQPDADRPGAFAAAPVLDADRTLSPGQKLAFILTGVEADSPDTTGQIAVLESLGDGTVGRGTVPVFPVRAGGPAITRFTAEPVAVTPGETVTLTWETTGGDYKLTESGGAAIRVPPRGTKDVAPLETTQYTLTAVPGGTPQAQVTVAVPEAYIVSLKASPYHVAVGAETAITWVARHAVVAMLDGQEVASAAAGSARVRHDTPGPATHELYVSSVAFDDSGPGGTTDSKRVPVQVHGIEASLTADDQVVPVGGRTTLRWTTNWAASQRIDPGIGPVPTTGSVEVAPQGARTTYALTAAPPPGTDGYAPKVAQVTVKTAPTILQLAINLGIEPPTVAWDGIGESATWGPADGRPRSAVGASGSGQIVSAGWETPPHELRIGHGGQVLRVRIERAGAPLRKLLLNPAQMRALGVQAVNLRADEGLTTPEAAVAASWSAQVLVAVSLPGAEVPPGAAVQRTFAAPRGDYHIALRPLMPLPFAPGPVIVTVFAPSPGVA